MKSIGGAPDWSTAAAGAQVLAEAEQAEVPADPDRAGAVLLPVVDDRGDVLEAQRRRASSSPLSVTSTQLTSPPNSQVSARWAGGSQAVTVPLALPSIA